ncbi:MAG: GNAT family N-acetyltransferase [Alphaproteobacteria bacterium]|nr:GNAT family N-acetyltransferase [Alphaproteobacteria bacterium]
MKVEPVTLANDFIRLEPHEERHRAGLRAAANLDPTIFRYMPGDLSGANLDPWFDWTLTVSDGVSQRTFTVIRQADDRVVGSTRYLNIAIPDKRLEIGFTWYARDAWAGPVNPSAKLLLMGHAFETLRFNRVEYKTDARNERSRAAIARLGAVQEGIFRKHMVLPNGYVRDSVYFSVIDSEWPAVKQGLEARLKDF